MSPYDENADASTRTNLAAERTVLAWWRSGLTALGVSLAVGKVVPDLGDHATRWPYAALGVAFALVGIGMVLAGTRRHNDVTGVRAFAIVTAVLGLASAAIVIVNP